MGKQEESSAYLGLERGSSSKGGAATPGKEKGLQQQEGAATPGKEKGCSSKIE